MGIFRNNFSEGLLCEIKAMDSTTLEKKVAYNQVRTY
jgi:hypothetical protein